MSLAVVVLLFTVVVALFRQGGLAPGADIILAVGICLGAAPALAGWSRLASRSRAPARVVVPMAAFGVWALADGTLHGQTQRALPWAATAAAVALVLVTVATMPPRDRATLRDGLILVGVLLGLATWGALVLHRPLWSATGRGLWRADGPLTYANATAAALVALTLLALSAVPGAVPGKASLADGNPSATPDVAPGFGPDAALVPGWAATATAVLLIAACAATLSRGGALGLAVGVAVTARLTDRSGRRALLAVLGGGAVAAAGLLPGLPASAHPQPLPAVVALAAGVLMAHLLTTRPWAPSGRFGAVVRGHAALSALVTLVVVVVVVASGVLAPRLTLSTSYRGSAALAGLRAWVAHPLTGVGPAQSTVTWRGDDGASRTLAFLHDEYLQVLMQFGLPGLVLVLTVIAALVVALRAGQPSTATGRERRLWVAAVAAAAAFAVHSGLDFLWHLPALPVLVAAAVGLGLPAAPDPPAPTGAAEPPSREGVPS